MSEELEPNDKSQALSEEVYITARQSYDAAELDVSGRYDKWILTLAGGALGLSVTFIEKIAKNPTPDTLCWLKGAWFFLIGALLLALVSLVTSQSAIRENRSELDSANAEDRAPDLSAPKWFTKLTNWLNWVSLASFIVGVILLCTFSFKNIDTSVNGQKKGADDGKQQTTNTTAKANNGGVRPSASTTPEGRRAGLRPSASTTPEGRRGGLRPSSPTAAEVLASSPKVTEVIHNNGVLNEHQEDKRRGKEPKQENGGGAHSVPAAEAPSEAGNGQEDR